MRRVFFLFFILASFGVRAQNRSYEQMEIEYNRLKNEGKNDSVLLVAREMNKWAFMNEGDTSLRYAVSFRYIGNGFENYDSSLVYYSMSQEKLEAQDRRNHLEYALCLYNLGRLFQEKDDGTRALSYFLESYDIFTLIKRDDHPIYRFCINNLAMLYLEMQDYAEAELCYLKCLQLTGYIYGEDHLEYARILSLLGALSKELGDIAKAESYYLHSLGIRKKTLGEDHPDYAMSLQNLGILYSEKGEYVKAEPYYLQTLEIYKKILGEDHLDYAAILNNLGNFYSRMGEYAKAEPDYLQSLEIYKKTLGEDHPDYATSLQNLGVLYWYMGDYAKAESYYLQSLEIRNKTLGEDHPDYVTSLQNLGLLYSDMGDYAKAESYYLHSLEIGKKTLGENHLDYVRSIQNLGVLYSDMGDYAKAEPYYLQSLEIYKKTLSVDHPDYARSIQNLGLLYWEMGDYAKAETYYLQSLEIRKKTLGEDHPDYARSIQNLGILYSRMGNFAKAELFDLQFLEINRKTLGEDHPDYATSLQNLGVLYSAMGDYATAELYYLQSFEIRKKALGEDHPDYAAILNNLGVLYSHMGDNAKAETYYLQSLGIKKKTLGEDHPDYASSIQNLGILYSDMGDYAKAEPYYLQSLEIEKKTLGEDHPDNATSLQNLGVLYSRMGDYAKAEPYFLQSLKIYKKTLGEGHPDYAHSLSLLGQFYIELDNLGTFEDTYFSYFPSCQEALRRNASLNSKTKNTYKENYTYQLYPFFCYLSYSKNESSRIQLAGFNHWLFLNGWVGDRDALLSCEVGAAGDTALAVLYEDYRMLRIQLSKHYELTMDELAKRGIDIEKEEQTAERMESELAVMIESFKRINAVYDFEDLREQIRSDEAFVDILQVPYYDFKNRTWPDSSLYMAYVVTADTREAPLLINLGDGKRMEEEVFPYLMGQITASRSSTMDGAVYNYLWKPLEASMEGKRHIYLSAGGIYHNLNPETIYHAENGIYLYEEKDIHLVSSGRAFVDQRFYGSRNYTDETALLMGSPDFDASGESADQKAFFSPGMTYATMRDLTQDGTFLAKPLPATLQEVESIRTSLSAANWDVELYTGVNAREDQLKRMSSPRILHLATHGFFMEDTENREESAMSMLGMDVQRVAENPMLRSGLLLAGCNKTLADNTPLTGADNGILTAYEAGLLDLSKTELVVLSACETGKGEILNGEGVQGLRKAMTDAGAEHILMSLWKVDDKVTAEYMQTFYGHYAQGKSIRESYNLTRNEIKQKYPQPYYWGAFVLVGE